MQPHRARCRDGFTLIELVVVLILLSLVLTLAAPMIGTGKPSARDGVAAVVRTARIISMRRGEVMELEIDRSGAWRLLGLGSADREPVLAGRVAAPHAGLRLVISPLGLCGPAPGTSPDESLQLEPLGCELGPP